MNFRAAICVFVAALLAGLPVWTEEVNSRGIFALRNACKPIELFVAVEGDAADNGLTKDQVATTVRSRLRGARIYTEESENHLFVGAHVVGRRFRVGFEFRKRPLDHQWILDDETLFGGYDYALQNGGFGIVASWCSSLTGTYGQDAACILSAVAESTDVFIDEYLRVNAEACKGEAIPFMPR